MPISCFSSSAPASQDGNLRTCLGALLRACKRSRSVSWGEDRIDEFQKNPNFKKISEEEFHKLYKVKKTIGVGGFSIVRKGKHIPTGQDVAIKVIDRSKYDPNDGSLEAEIVVLDKVRHPYCISFKECYFTRKRVYVITELVTGGELLDRVLKHGKYGEQQAARIMKQILQGVAYLHSIGVMHRDLKLENILLKSHEEDAPIKIADFGLAKIFAGAAPLTTICGSPQYVAPEVLEVGHKRLCYTPAADLWSTGVIMYILLSGFSPFDDPNEAILFQKIKKGMFSMKQPVWETVSYEGKDLMRRLLVTMPEKRLTAKQALRHPWFQIMLMEEPTVDTPEKQGTSGDPQEGNEVFRKQLEQQIEARQYRVTGNSEPEQLPASPETEPGGEVLAASQITARNDESDQVTQRPTVAFQQDNLSKQQNMSDHVHAPQEIDEEPETLVQELGENLETTVQEIVEHLGTLVEASGEKTETLHQGQEPTDHHEVQELTSQEEIGNITEKTETLQQVQEPTDHHEVQLLKSQEEISNITETETRSAS